MCRNPSRATLLGQHENDHSWIVRWVKKQASSKKHVLCKTTFYFADASIQEISNPSKILRMHFEKIRSNTAAIVHPLKFLIIATVLQMKATPNRANPTPPKRCLSPSQTAKVKNQVNIDSYKFPIFLQERQSSTTISSEEWGYPHKVKLQPT